MNIINHEIIGEGYYFIDKENKLTFIKKEYKRLAKKLNKRGYNELTSEQLDERLTDFIERFECSLHDITIEIEGCELVTNVLRLWYKDNFCHAKMFNNGIVTAFTTSLPVYVNTCNEVVDLYPTIRIADMYMFGEFVFIKKTLYDKDLQDLYAMYKVK